MQGRVLRTQLSVGLMVWCVLCTPRRSAVRLGGYVWTDLPSAAKLTVCAALFVLPIFGRITLPRVLPPLTWVNTRGRPTNGSYQPVRAARRLTTPTPRKQ